MTAPTTELTGAALLREAARLMRERAEVTTAAAGDGWYAPQDLAYTTREVGAVRMDDGDAEHIASWHPAVALAVAEWLEWTAGVADERKHAPGCDACTPAEAVARAYLGQS